MKLIPRGKYFRVDNSFNGLGMLKSIIGHWYLFAIAIPAFIAGSVYLMKGADFKYIVNASFKVHREFEFPTHGAENRITGLRLHAKIANIYNYIGSVDTYAILYEAMYDLDFDVEYFKNGKNNYGHSPFRVSIDRSGNNLSGLNFKVEQVGKELVRVKATSDKYFVYDYKLNTTIETHFEPFQLDTTLIFDQPLAYQGLQIAIHKNQDFNPPADSARYSFSLVDPSVLAQDYKMRMRVKTLNKGASILTLGITTAKKDEDSDLINRMMEVYERIDLDAKNGMARNTVRFLEQQMALIYGDIAATQDTIVAIKKDHNMLNLSMHATDLLKESDRLSQQKAELKTKLEYYKYILEYAQKQVRLDTLLSPSLAGVQDVNLINLVQQHTRLSLDRQEVLFHAGPKNPRLIMLTNQVDQSRLAILESINGLISQTEIQLGGVRTDISKNNFDISRLPKLEREIVSNNRTIANNLSLYKYLSKKKGQAELALASNIPDCEIWERAHIKGNKIVAPLVSLSHLMMFMVGLMIPFVVILIKGLISEKITNIESLVKLSKFEVIGTAPRLRKRKRKNYLLGKASKKVNEIWGAHELSLEHYVEDRKIITFSSPHKKAGTTTAASHLAYAASQQGKKVVYVNFNGYSPDSHYTREQLPYSIMDLAQGKCSYDQLFQEQDKVKLVDAGAIQTDPSVVFSGHTLQELFRYLKHDFDYVILDVPDTANEQITDKLAQFAEHWVFSFCDNISETSSIETMHQFTDRHQIQHASVILMHYMALEFTWPWKKLDWDVKKKNFKNRMRHLPTDLKRIAWTFRKKKTA